MRAALRSVAHGAVVAILVGLVGTMAIVFGGLAAGYRPVVIQTGSMGETAPPGSLVIAAPRDGQAVGVGDVLVMRREGKATVTHRVIEIEVSGTARFAITKGDANEAVDATPYPLEGSQLVGRWYLPGWGRRLQRSVQPDLALGLVGIALVAFTVGQLRRIWRPGHGGAPEDTGRTVDGATAPPSAASVCDPGRDPARRRRRRLALASIPLTAVSMVGVSWALFDATDQATANLFSTRDCFDPRLASVQDGATIHAVDGAVTVPITAVDPTRSFVLASVASAGSDPVDATVQTRLAGGGTQVELLRHTDAGAIAPVTVSWSVVEYACGVTVQRGTTAGDGDTRVDVAITAVDPSTSFVSVSSAAASSDIDFDGDDLLSATLTSSTGLALSADAPLDPGRSIAWQVISFDDPGDVLVQRLSTTLGPGVTDAVVAIPQAADPASTFVLAAPRSAVVGGTDLASQMVRANLDSASGIRLTRSAGASPVSVDVQVVTLRDGSTVRHGTVDLAPAQEVATVDVTPVDLTRSTAVSTVAVPGLAAGGSTTMTADDIAGEATATFTLTDPTTVELARDASSSAASFGWQVIEWAGPRWWDPSWAFRQRIDVGTDAAAPDGYTVPVEVDHDALVTNGLARPDGADVRVLRWNGATWTELDRILDDDATWGTATTTLLFRTRDPIDANDHDSYWLYFGNAAAGPPPADPGGVFALVEDFESGTLGDFEDRTAGSGWYEADPWTWRRPLTVPPAAVATDLADHRIVVSLTDPSLASAARADGTDIRFLAADGTSPLPHEIERWNPATGELTAWVRLPSLSATGTTTLSVVAGAPNAPDRSDPRQTWSGGGTDAVWHLAEGPGRIPQVDDRGPRNADGITRGAMTGTDVVDGIIGSALDLDGLDDHLEVPAVPIGASGRFTVSAWIRPDGFGADAAILSATDSTGAEVTAVWLERIDASTARVHGTVTVDGSAIDVAGGTVAAGSWHHVGLVHDGAEAVVVVDGAASSTVPAAGVVTQPGAPMVLGDHAGAGMAFDGRLDEVRIDQVDRPTAWFAAMVSNATGSLPLVGAAETGVWLTQGTWAARKPLVIPAGAATADLADHVVLVSLVDADLAASARADGRDIVFTDADGTTRLDHVIESWDPGTGALEAWVRFPLVRTADVTEGYLYYANPSAGDQQDAAAVFGTDGALTLLGD